MVDFVRCRRWSSQRARPKVLNGMGLSKSANIEKKERGSRGSSGGGQGANGVRLKSIRLLFECFRSTLCTCVLYIILNGEGLQASHTRIRPPTRPGTTQIITRPQHGSLPLPVVCNIALARNASLRTFDRWCTNRRRRGQSSGTKAPLAIRPHSTLQSCRCKSECLDHCDAVQWPQSRRSVRRRPFCHPLENHGLKNRP